MRIEKPWGYEIIWAHTEHYVGKIIHIRPGKRLSKQRHIEKEESIFVMSGTLRLYLDGEKTELSPGESFHVAPGVIHRFGAGKEIVELMEISTTQLDDVIRIEDDFGRE